MKSIELNWIVQQLKPDHPYKWNWTFQGLVFTPDSSWSACTLILQLQMLHNTFWVSEVNTLQLYYTTIMKHSIVKQTVV